jgi:hypothetical protein
MRLEHARHCHSASVAPQSRRTDGTQAGHSRRDRERSHGLTAEPVEQWHPGLAVRSVVGDETGNPAAQ